MTISPIKPPCCQPVSTARAIRKNIGAFCEYLWQLSSSIRHPRADVLIVEGEEIKSKETISLLYIGNYKNLSFVCEALYTDYRVTKKQGGILALQAQKWIKTYADSVDLLFLDLEPLYCRIIKKSGFLVIPHWVRQCLLIPDTWKGVYGKFRKNTKKTDLRKVRKYGFTSTISTKEEDFTHFYHHMHKPYLQNRFGNVAMIEPEWKVLRQCRKGELLQVVRDGEVFGCVLLHQTGGRLAGVWVGLPGTLDDEMYKGVFSALYYFTIVYGYEKGCDEIDFLGSRPLLNDGVFRYKRKWGMVVQESHLHRGDILLKPLRFNKGLVNFFRSNSFITRGENGLAGRVLFDNGLLNSMFIDEIVIHYATEGLATIKIFSLSGVEQGLDEWLRLNNKPVEVFDLSQSVNPAEDFCLL